MDWTMIASVTALCTVAGTIFNYAVIKPLSEKISELGRSIDRLQESMERIEEKRQEMDKRLIVVEQSVSSAHHRIDEMRKG